MVESTITNFVIHRKYVQNGLDFHFKNNVEMAWANSYTYRLCLTTLILEVVNSQEARCSTTCFVAGTIKIASDCVFC